MKIIPLPHTVREMTDADCINYGVCRDDYPADRLWLALWHDRSGYYTEGLDNPPPDARYCASVFNESEIFPDAEAVQAWIYHRLEIQGDGYTGREVFNTP